MRNKEDLRLKRHRKIRLKIFGTTARPRLTVQRSLKNFSAQVIDDTQNKTLLCLNSLDKEVRQKYPRCQNINSSAFFGEVFARRAKEKGITSVVFDRAGYLFHGRIKAFAEALRKGGLKF